MGTRSKKPRPSPSPPPPTNEVVVCKVDRGKPTACGRVVGPGGSKSAELCSRCYTAWKRHPDRPLVGRPEKVAGHPKVPVKSHITQELAGLVEKLRAGRNLSAWVATAIEEKARRDAGPERSRVLDPR